MVQDGLERTSEDVTENWPSGELTTGTDGEENDDELNNIL
jgi:hypothetical protein